MLIQESELHIIICAPGNKEKKVYKLKDSTNEEPINVVLVWFFLKHAGLHLLGKHCSNYFES